MNPQTLKPSNPQTLKLKRFSCLLKSSKGLSPVQMMITVFFAGIVALGLISVVTEKGTLKKRRDAHFEIKLISNLITQNLLDEESCTQTLGAGTTLFHNRPIREIKNREGTPVFDVSEYGGELVKIDSIKLKNVSLQGIPGKERKGKAGLEIVFKKLGSLFKGANLAQRFPLQVKVDASDRLIKCSLAAALNCLPPAIQSLASIFVANTSWG